VQRPIYNEFLEAFSEKVSRLVTGNPMDEATDVSALASNLAVRRIAAQLEEGRQKGAQITVGGKVKGNLIYPTVVKNATDDMLGMREEVFGPVAFTSPFDTVQEVISRAANHKYGLRAAVFGGPDAQLTAAALKGEDYCHPVQDYTFGKFGTVALNQTRAVSWRGAFVTKPVGGYGYSGWIWETINGQFRMKQGAKLLSLETSTQSG
jgi:acyl-CoA reductase-like NAD-dependent aldehyde dehydrogenase